MLKSEPKAPADAKPRAAPAAGSTATLPNDARGRTIARTTFTVLLVLLGLWLTRDFLTPIAWAAVIAITAWPLYRRFAALISSSPSPIVAPLIFTLAVGVLLLLPFGLALHRVAQESEKLVAAIGELQQNGIPVPVWLAQMPVAGERVVSWWQANLTDPKATAGWLRSINVESLTAWSTALGVMVLHGLVLMFFAMLALFFILRDGAWIANRVLDTADRLLGDPGEKLASKMVVAVRGTVNGTIVVALVEGIIIGAGYFLADVPSPLLFTLLTVAFAMLPFGAWAAFTAASLALLAQGGSGFAAAAVFGWGAVVMLIGDHFVWPTIVGGAARLPFLLALIGIFGGLQTFGLLGLFVGPVVMAALLTVWREWLIARKPATPG